MKPFYSDPKSDRIAVLERILLTSKIEGEKLEAINQLKIIRESRAQLAIIKALTDKFDSVRDSAILSFSPSIVPEEILIPFLITLINDENPKIRERAVKLLSEIAKEEYLPYFTEKLKDDSEKIRTHAIQAIGKICKIEHLELLLNQFNKETSIRTKRAVLQAISQIRGESTTEFLLQVLQNENEKVEVRSEAAFLLVKMNSPKALDTIISLIKTDILIDFRLNLIQSLGYIHNEKNVDFLINIATTELQKQDLQTSLRKYQYNIYNIYHCSFNALSDPDKIILTVIKTLGTLKHPNAIPFLLKSLDSVYTLIRLQSAGALFQFDDDSINQRLLAILYDATEDTTFKEILTAVLCKINRAKMNTFRVRLTMDMGISRNYLNEFFN